MQHVHLKQRLGTCALVCSSWQKAAVEATTSLKVGITNNSCKSLASWLNINGSSLHVLSIVQRQQSADNNQGRCQMLLNFHKLQQLRSLSLSDIDISPTNPDTKLQAANSSFMRLRSGNTIGIEAAARAAEAQHQRYLLGNSVSALTALTS